MQLCRRAAQRHAVKILLRNTWLADGSATRQTPHAHASACSGSPKPARKSPNSAPS